MFVRAIACAMRSFFFLNSLKTCASSGFFVAGWRLLFCGFSLKNSVFCLVAFFFAKTDCFGIVDGVKSEKIIFN